MALLGCKSLLEMSPGSLAFETGIAVTDVVAQVESTKRHESQSLRSLGDWKSPNPGHPLAQISKVSSTVQPLLHLFYPVCVFKGVCRVKRTQACGGGRHLCGIPTSSLQHTICKKKMRNERWQCCNETWRFLCLPLGKWQRPRTLPSYSALSLQINTFTAMSCHYVLIVELEDGERVI